MSGIIFAILTTVCIVSFIGDVVTGFTSTLAHLMCICSAIGIVIMITLIGLIEYDIKSKLRLWWS